MITPKGERQRSIAEIMLEVVASEKIFLDAVNAMSLQEIVGDALEDKRYANHEEDLRDLLLSIGKTVSAKRVDLPEPIMNAFQFSGKEIHQRGCAAAATWLEQSGREWACCNLQCPGGFADVVTWDGKLTVEVGYTEAHKVLKCLAEGITVLLVPYITGRRFGVLLEPLPGSENLLAEQYAEQDAVRAWHHDHLFDDDRFEMEEVFIRSLRKKSPYYVPRVATTKAP